MPSPIATSTPLEVGQDLAGKYRILSLLGEGGMGVVFAATHLDLERKVAIKVIQQDLAQFPEIVARLIAEARAAARIHSEHVCRVLDVGRLDSGAPYIVMEHLEGADLGQLLSMQGPMAEPAAIDLLLEACEAVAEAHAAGIIHRDLKPENLFLARLPDGRSSIKVLDFGISKAVGESNRRGSLALTSAATGLGSPHFMAPEQMHDARDVDPRADIWALGAILYQLLTGKLAFDGDTITAVCAAVLQADPTPVRSLSPHVTPGVELAIARCLSKNRDDRFASVAELALAVAPFGSARASVSVERISRVLGKVDREAERTDVLWSSTPPGVSPRETLESSSVTRTVDPGKVGADRGLGTLPRPSPKRVRRHRAQWLIGVTAPAIVVLGIALARGRSGDSAGAVSMVTASPSMTTAAAMTRASEPSVRPRASAADTREVAEPTPGVSARPAGSVAPKVEAPRRKPTERSVSPGVVRPRASSAVNPWNPDTFGGRR